MSINKSIVLRMVVLCLCVWIQTSPAMARSSRSRNKKDKDVPMEQQQGIIFKTQAKNFKPFRTRPVFTGAFSVGLIFVEFPDCQKVDTQKALKDLNQFGPRTLQEYYKEYSQGITWPELIQIGGVYKAPHPLGYYCRHYPHSNELGWGDEGEGGKRVGQLKSDATEFAFKGFKGKRPQVNSVTYHNARLPFEELEKNSVLRKAYPKPEGDPEKVHVAYDKLRYYSPSVAWAEPLWPNSSVQVFTSSGGGTMCHELGHVLGAPDFYHAPEINDGLPGSPCLGSEYGPTGPAYCRAFYQAFLPASSYPIASKGGTYTLLPRNTPDAADKVVGYLIPSSHPNYLFYVEYVHGDQAPLGSPGKQGLLIHAINVTKGDAFVGGPDLCYTYRPGDPYFRSEVGLGNAYLGEGDTFDAESDPAAILPNQLPAGISISDIVFNETDCSFKLTIDPIRIPSYKLKASLLPQIKLETVDELQPTSLRAHAFMVYRGEPLKTEYGFVYGTAPRPTYRPTSAYPLYHRDRYNARILGLRPGATYYVRAYVKNANGITYSPEEKRVTLPKITEVTEVPPLLTDAFTGNWEITKYYSMRYSGERLQGSSMITAMLKLMCYYRMPLNGKKPRRGRDVLDYKQIHTSPTSSRPRHRMGSFHRAFGNEARSICEQAGLFRCDFDKRWDRTFCKVFGLKNSRGREVLFDVTDSTITKHEARIKKNLIAARPVLFVRESLEMTPVSYALDGVLIDGFREDGQYHLVFPSGCDRNKGNRKSGYYPLSVLFDETLACKIIFFER